MQYTKNNSQKYLEYFKIIHNKNVLVYFYFIFLITIGKIIVFDNKYAFSRF